MAMMGWSIFPRSLEYESYHQMQLKVLSGITLFFGCMDLTLFRDYSQYILSPANHTEEWIEVETKRRISNNHYHHHHHQITLTAWSSLTLSNHPSPSYWQVFLVVSCVHTELPFCLDTGKPNASVMCICRNGGSK